MRPRQPPEPDPDASPRSRPGPAPARGGRPLFIFGCPRSGTSLLTRMLGSHPDLAIPYESHLYNQIYPFVCGRGDLGRPGAVARLVREIIRTEHVREWEPPPSPDATLAAIPRPDFHGVVEGLLSAWARGQGKSRWGEKTPQHTLWWRTILSGFPDMQVIHLVRDGRDVALSYRAAHFGPKHVYHLAKRWAGYLSVAEEAQATLGEGAFLPVRYEALLAEPERELRRVCDFLGLSFAPATLSFHQDAVPYPTDRHNIENLRRPVLRHNSGKWRAAMTHREVRIFEALAGSWLDRYGYPRALRDAGVSRWEAISCRFLEHPPRRALALLKNRQGQRLALQSLRLRLRLRPGP